MTDTIIKKFYTSLKINNESVIAYKGGLIEKNLLAKLKIPTINLESFGCPKADNIFPEMGWLESCGQHKLLKNTTDTYQHCPKVEVEAYLHWLMNKCKQKLQIKTVNKNCKQRLQTKIVKQGLQNYDVTSDGISHDSFPVRTVTSLPALYYTTSFL